MSELKAVKKELQIVLVYPPTNLRHWMFVPEGTARIAAYLKEQELNVRQINLDVMMRLSKCNNKEELSCSVFDTKAGNVFLQDEHDTIWSAIVDKIPEVLELLQADIVGFSVTFPSQRNFALCLASMVKKRTGALVVFGGFHADRVAHSLLREYAFIDYVVKGGGEISMAVLSDMAEKKAIVESEVPGLVYRTKNNRTVENPTRSCQLDRLPVPDYGGTLSYYFDLIRTLKEQSCSFSPLMLPYQISKGCFHKCRFCCFAIFEQIDYRSPQKAVSDLRNLIETCGVKRFYFGANTLNMNKEHMVRLCKELIRSRLDFMWTSFLRPEGLDRKTLGILKASGCEVLEFGVDSASQRLLDLLNKKMDLQEAEQVLRRTYQAGIHVKIHLMLNIPTETPTDVQAAISFIRRNSSCLDMVVVHRFMYPPWWKDTNSPHPGTWCHGPPTNVEEIKELFRVIRNYKHIVLVGNIETFFEDTYSYLMQEHET